MFHSFLLDKQSRKLHPGTHMLIAGVISPAFCEWRTQQCKQGYDPAIGGMECGRVYQKPRAAVPMHLPNHPTSPTALGALRHGHVHPH